MGNLIFSERAWEEYLYWQTQDKKTLKRINLLLKDILRNGFQGLGKSEPLRGNLSGLWGRRIDDKNRLVFKMENDHIEIIQLRGHYDD